MLSRAELLPSFQRWAKTGPGQIVLAASGVVLLISGLVLFGSAAAAQEKGPYQFLVCPRCEHQQPYNQMMAYSICVKCRADALAPRRRSSIEGSVLPTTASGKALMFGLIAVMALQVIVYSWITHARSWKPEDEEEWYKIRCPKCRGKMAYPASKSGLSIRCSRCRNEVALPD